RDTPREGPRDGEDRDHVAEPRLRRRSGLRGEARMGTESRQPQRQYVRGTAALRVAGVLGAVSSRGLAGTARRELSVPSFPRAHETQKHLTARTFDGQNS